MFDAIKRANSLDGKAIRDALAATKDFPGVTGQVTFNENRDAVKQVGHDRDQRRRPLCGARTGPGLKAPRCRYVTACFTGRVGQPRGES